MEDKTIKEILSILELQFYNYEYNDKDLINCNVIVPNGGEIIHD